MKRHILIILIIAYCTNSYSQISFEIGYFIDNDNKKTNCLIKNMDWESNPTKFEYKLSEESESKKKTIQTVKEFGVINVSKYIKSTVNIDRSSENINKLTTNKNPVFNEEALFLKVLIQGKASLYEYKDANLKRYFYNKGDSKIKQLIFKSYKDDENKLKENNTFREQLFDALNCSDFKIDNFLNLDYYKKALVNLFVEYNECMDETLINYEDNVKRDVFNLNIRPRIVNSSLVINGVSELRDFDFDNSTNFGFGIEAEFILSFNKNKWAIIVEPTYQSYKNEKSKDVGVFFGGELGVKINYNSIELPVGLRHYLFLNETSKVFVNILYIQDYSFNSSSEYIRADGFDLAPLLIETKGTNNWGFGFGYKWKDKFSLEFRHQTSREILGGNVSDVSKYGSNSLILGYSIF